MIDDPSLGVRLTSAAFHLCRQCEWENVRELLYESYGFVQPSAEPIELRAVASSNQAQLVLKQLDQDDLLVVWIEMRNLL